MPQYQWSAAQTRLSSGDIQDLRIPVGGTPAYHVFHLRSGYDINELDHIAVGVENILNRLYKTHGSGVYQPGASFYLRVSHGI